MDTSLTETRTVGCGCYLCMHGRPDLVDREESLKFDSITSDASVSNTGPNAQINEFADYLTNGFWQDIGGNPRSWDKDNITFYISNEFSSNQRAGIRMAFDLWDDVADISFTEVTKGADIQIYEGDERQAYSLSTVSGTDILKSFIHIDTNVVGWSNFNNLGDYALMTALHEIGHSLGLGHSGNYNGSASYGSDAQWSNDTHQMSLMSYFNDTNVGSDHWNKNGIWQYSATPMLVDILAIQNIYGADYSTRSGDTIYGFNSTADRDQFDFSISQVPIAIWDGGGRDTLDLSGYSQDQIIYLTQGDFSSTGYMTNNIVIAFGTVIENAIGGSGNDDIYGNDADNIILGGAGADTFYGSLGNDILDAESGDDVLVYSYTLDSFEFSLVNANTFEFRNIIHDFIDTAISFSNFVFNEVNYFFDDLVNLLRVKGNSPEVNDLVSSVEYATSGIVADGLQNSSVIDAVPDLTSDVSAAGNVITSGAWSTNYSGWQAFDGSSQTRPWAEAWNGEHYIGFEFTENKVINKYSISTRGDHWNGQARAPKDWVLEGSEDGINWVTLDTRTNISGWGVGERREFAFTNDQDYKSYRINIDANNNNNKVAVIVGEVDFIEAQEEAGHLIYIDQDISLSDDDSTIIAGAEIRLSDARNTIAEELLSVTTQDALVSSYEQVGDEYVLTISGDASVSVYEEVLESLTYQNIASGVVNGSRNISITVTDDTGSSSPPKNISLDVVRGDANDNALQALNDSFVGDEDSVIRGNVLSDNGNGSDIGDDGLSVEASEFITINGAIVSLQSNGDFAYTPPENYVGIDSFEYILTNGRGATSKGVVTLTLNNVDDPLIAVDDVVSTASNEAIVIDVTSNDINIDNDILSVSIVSQALHGSLSVVDGGMVSYTPNLGYTGTDSFIYQISDGLGDSTDATVSIDVVANSSPEVDDLVSSVEYATSGIVADGLQNSSVIDAVPDLTSDVSAAGNVITSGAWSTNYSGWQAFDGSSQTRPWAEAWNGEHYIGFEFTENKVINKYSISTRGDHWNGQARAPKDWVLEGSEDGINWVTLDTRTNISGWGVGERREFAFTNDQDYKSYRINIDANNNNNKVAVIVGEVDFIEAQEEAGHLIYIDQDISLSDDDSTIIAGAEIRLSDARNTIAEELLSVTTQDALVSSYEQVGDEYVLTISGDASVSVYEEVLESLTYQNIASGVVNGSRNISITVTDDTGSSSPPKNISLDVAGGIESGDLSIAKEILFVDTPEDEILEKALFNLSHEANTDAEESEILSLNDVIAYEDALTRDIADFVQHSEQPTAVFDNVDLENHNSSDPIEPGIMSEGHEEDLLEALIHTI